jgi:chromosome segregation ATPase
VLEGILYFVLGFLSAALIALMISPAIWNRAVVLTRRRIEASVPLTLNEIQADKDQLRAEFAMSTRRLEMSIEELREKAARQVIEVNRKRDELARLSDESRERLRKISELEAGAADLRSQWRDREDQLTIATQRLDETRGKLESRALELERLRARLAETETDQDSRRIEIVARETMLESLSGKVGTAEERERAARMELAALKEEHARAVSDLDRERERVSEITRRANRLEAQLAEREENLQRRERDLARMREVTGSGEANAAEIAAELVQEKARVVELEAKIAQSALQMEALLNDASNDNVEKAMASMNLERGRLEADLAAVTTERDNLLQSLNTHMRDKSRDWEVERRENAILRERINDLAAQVTAMTAALEGEGSAIEAIIQMAPKPANAEAPRPPAGAGEGQPVTLAERIRALQSSARQNKAS